MALGITAGIGIDIHLELLHKFEEGSVWELWCAIESQHVQQDASLRHVTWMGLLGLRKEADESYSKYLRRLSEGRDKVDRVTPQGRTAEQRMGELLLFIAYSGLFFLFLQEPYYLHVLDLVAIMKTCTKFGMTRKEHAQLSEDIYEWRLAY